MEMKTYLRVLVRKWWIVVPAFLITFVSTMVFTFAQAPTYQATATFIVAPSGSAGDVRTFVSYLDTLSRQVEIANTYTQLAISRQVRDEVVEALGLSTLQNKSLAVESKMRAGTNVMDIRVEGNDPVLVADFANKIGEHTVGFSAELYEAYQLIPLDPALPPQIPISPNTKLNLALGAVLGLALGGGLAFLSDYMQAPLGSYMNLDILDAETGAYNKRYFVQRLGEEMSRAKRNKYPLSLALMNIDHTGVMRSFPSPQSRTEALRKVTVFLRQYLRQEDVMARVDGTTFGFLLPDVPEEKAKAVMEKLQSRLAWSAFEMETSGIKLNLSGAAGIAAYSFNGTAQAELLENANHALRQAEAAGYGKVAVFVDGGQPDDSES